MKKLALTLVLSLGLVNATFAAAPAEQAPEATNNNQVIAWMKANPKKATVLIASIIVAGSAAGVYLAKDTEFMKPKLEKVKEKYESAKKSATEKRDASWTSIKAHPYITGAVVTSIVAVAGLAAYDLTRDADKSQLKKLAKSIRKALCKEETEVVA
ncbi:hypothetical protein K2X40_02685 [Candidatus Babeliales bacterium]|nr:hypothetical protein [Candidatus Babeliales bacterium]